MIYHLEILYFLNSFAVGLLHIGKRDLSHLVTSFCLVDSKNLPRLAIISIHYERFGTIYLWLYYRVSKLSTLLAHPVTILICRTPANNINNINNRFSRNTFPRPWKLHTGAPLHIPSVPWFGHWIDSFLLYSKLDYRPPVHPYDALGGSAPV